MMDLEKDGFHEVVTDFGIFEQDGTQRCDFFFPQGFVAIADINMDGIETIGDQRDVIVSVKMARGAVASDEEEEEEAAEEAEATAEA